MADIVKPGGDLKDRQGVAYGRLQSLRPWEIRKFQITENNIPKHPNKRQSEREKIRENAPENRIPNLQRPFNFSGDSRVFIGCFCGRSRPKPMREYVHKVYYIIIK